MRTDLAYLPYPQVDSGAIDLSEVLLVDCSMGNETAALTHHRHPGYSELPRKYLASSSAGMCLKVMADDDHLSPLLEGKKYVSCNHYDVDGFCAVFAMVRPDIALEHRELVERIAHIGDFRELLVKRNAETGRIEPVSVLEDHALKTCCWLMAVERVRFFTPLEDRMSERDESSDKFEFFFGTFPSMLDNVESRRNEWEEEYTRVIEDLQLAHENRANFSDVGLDVVVSKRTLHNFALFSILADADGTSPAGAPEMVVTLCPGNRYELEVNYTSYVNFVERKQLPRINLRPLVKALNDLEKGLGSLNMKTLSWTVDSFNDYTPLLRLENSKKPLSKVDLYSDNYKYTDQYKREVYASGIRPEMFRAIVLSYLRYGFTGAKRQSVWTWNEIHEFNRSVDFTGWSPLENQ
eukprot:Clim_evm2s102 gene=Clim_evmTU2s102